LTISTNDEETIVPDAVQTPTSKLVGKKLLSLDGVRRSTTKESIVPTEEVGMINSIEAPTSKPIAKRSANVDGVDVIAPKETKIACVKIIVFSRRFHPYLFGCVHGIWISLGLYL
jgi:hypothetical protein